MKKHFSYSILQYKHSLLLNEAINVGILFSFPEDKVLHFSAGNLSRIKVLYFDFDASLVNKILKNIENKIQYESSGLFNAFATAKSEEELQNVLLREDDSALQFSRPKSAPYPFDNVVDIVEQYTALLLPIAEDRRQRVKYDERFILKKFTSYILDIDKSAESVIKKNQTIDSHGVKLKFDVVWKNGTTNLVKTVSFDLKEEQDIQHKSITYFGYLTKLKEYAKLNEIRYDLLIWSPQEKHLFKEFDKALEIILSADSPKRIVTENNLKNYSEEAAYYLIKRGNELRAGL